ncbi:ATP-binding protein [Streptomyces bungoensis]
MSSAELLLPPADVPVRLPEAEVPALRPAAAVPAPRPPGGEHPGRLPGADAPDPLASGAAPSGPAAAFDLPAAPASVGTARRVLRDLLAAWGVAEDTRDDAVLVASELVTNALVHAAGERIACRVRWAAGRVRVEVEDQNRGSVRPVPRQSGPDDQNGRGLFLVDALTADWGVTAAPGRPARIVWAELTTPPGTPVPPLPRTVPHSSEGTHGHAPLHSRPEPARRPVLDPDPPATGTG